jgi:hypothetical protein
VPSIHSLAKVAKALRVTISDLVLGNSDRERLMEITRTLRGEALHELLTHARRLSG